MKSFLIGILFSFLTAISFSQNTVMHQNWKVEHGGEWASFNWCVSRTKIPDYQGKYYYYVYFFSNSYFDTKSNGRDYDKASTYIKNVGVVMNEYRFKYGNLEWVGSVPLKTPGYTCEWAYIPEYYVFWFSSYSPYNKFILSYGKVSAWDYSIY